MADWILDIKENQLESKLDFTTIEQQFGDEQYTYQGTPYNYIRYFLNFINPGEEEVIYDFGCGYGRIVLYGAITRKSRFRGIEIVPERAKKAEIIKNFLKLENAMIIPGNILDQDFSDGNIFFLFNPFSYRTLEAVGEHLKKIAQQKNIRIVTWGGTSNEYFGHANWLTEIPHSHFSQLQFFES